MSTVEEKERHRGEKRHRRKREEKQESDLFDMTAPQPPENVCAPSPSHKHDAHREKSVRRKKDDDYGQPDVDPGNEDSPKKRRHERGDDERKHRKRREESPKHRHKDDEENDDAPEKEEKHRRRKRHEADEQGETSKREKKRRETEEKDETPKHDKKNHETEETSKRHKKRRETEEKDEASKRDKKHETEERDETSKREKKKRETEERDETSKREKRRCQTEERDETSKRNNSESPKKRHHADEEQKPQSPKQQQRSEEREQKKTDRRNETSGRQRENDKGKTEYSRQPRRRDTEQDPGDGEARKPSVSVWRRTQAQDEELKRSQGGQSRTDEKNQSGRARSTGRVHVRPPPKEQHKEEQQEEEPPHDGSPDGIAQWLMDGGSIYEVSPDMMPDVISSLQTKRDDYLVHHEVDLCEQADQLAVSMKDRLQLEMKLQAQRDQADNYIGRLQNAQDNCSNLEVTAKRTLQRIREKHAKEAEDLKQRQIEEENQLMERWQQPQIMRRFNRASPLLQAMRKQSTILLAQRNYKDLRENEKRVAVLEERERNEQYRFMRMEYDEQVRLLREKHKAEIEVLKVAQEGREQTFLAAAAVDLDRAKKRVQTAELNLDNTADADKLWNLRFRYERPPTSRSLTGLQARKIIVEPHSITDLRLPPLDPRKTTGPRGTIMRPQTTLHLAP